MEKIYDTLKTGYNDWGECLSQVPRTDTIYGEITANGVKTLVNSINFKDKHFLDIGSGVGKTVIQLALETDLKSSTGYEIIPARFNVSCQAKIKYDQLISSPSGSKVKFILNNLPGKARQFHHDQLDLSYYNIYFINNLTWSPTTTNQLLDALLANIEIGDTIIVSKRLASLDKIAKVSNLKVEMSWTETYLLTIYTITIKHTVL
jgi:hypothetical protein